MADSPPPMPGVTAHLTIPDRRGAEAIDYYAKALGATESARMLAEDGERIMHAHLTIRGGSLMLADEFPEYRGPAETGSGPPDRVVLHIDVDDVDRWFDRAIAAGGGERMKPEDMFWGQRYAQFNDPFGFAWAIGGPTKGESK